MSLWKKIAQNVAHPIFGQISSLLLRRKKWPNIDESK
jgi:hypothetical protein